MHLLSLLHPVIEVNAARPIFSSWIAELLSDCNNLEIRLISDTITALKLSLRRLKSNIE